MNTIAWTRGLAVVAVALVLIAPTTVHGQVKLSPTASQPSARPGRMIDLPAPMDQEQWQRYASEIVLSDGQRAFLAPAFERYANDYQSLRKAKLPEVEERGRDNVAAVGHGLEAELETWIAFREALAKLRRELRSVDEQFLGEVALVLAPEQQAAFERVKLRRARACRLQEYMFMGAASIDLVSILDSASLSTAEGTDAIAVIHEYDAVLTPIIIEADAEHIRLSRPIAEIGMRRRSRAANDAAGRAQDKAELDTYLVRAARNEHRVAERNKEFLQRLMAAVPPEDAEIIRVRFDTLAYDRLLPDPSSARSMLKLIRAQPDMPTDVAKAIDELRASYVASAATMENELRTLHDDWKVDFVSTMSSRGYQQYRTRAVEIMTRMCDASDQVVSQVVSLVPAEVMAGVQKELAAWHAAMGERRTLLASGQFPPV